MAVATAPSPAPARVKFVDPTRSTFFATLRQRVDAYFEDRQLSRHANGLVWAKTALYLTSFAGLYLWMLFGGLSGAALLGSALALGFLVAMIGFNVGHDALHGAMSSSSRVNKILGHSFTLLGANPYLWQIGHNTIHHTYTNIPGHDDDIDAAPVLMRMADDGPLHPWHRAQHFYGFALYALTTISWVLRKDYWKFFQWQGSAHVPGGRHPRAELFNLFFYKALNYTVFLVLPTLLLPYSFWQVLGGWALMHAASGLTLALVFQLAHVVEGPAFPLPDENLTIEDSWAVHQLRTTANFAVGSPLTAFLTGGLNQQVEHHLFPRICHAHYPALSAIIRETAAEYGLPYMTYPTFGTALASHYRTLRRFGAEAWQARRIAA